MAPPEIVDKYSKLSATGLAKYSISYIKSFITILSLLAKSRFSFTSLSISPPEISVVMFYTS